MKRNLAIGIGLPPSILLDIDTMYGLVPLYVRALPCRTYARVWDLLSLPSICIKFCSNPLNWVFFSPSPCGHHIWMLSILSCFCPTFGFACSKISLVWSSHCCSFGIYLWNQWRRHEWERVTVTWCEAKFYYFFKFTIFSPPPCRLDIWKFPILCCFRPTFGIKWPKIKSVQQRKSPRLLRD